MTSASTTGLWTAQTKVVMLSGMSRVSVVLTCGRAAMFRLEQGTSTKFQITSDHQPENWARRPAAALKGDQAEVISGLRPIIAGWPGILGNGRTDRFQSAAQTLHFGRPGTSSACPRFRDALAPER